MIVWDSTNKGMAEIDWDNDYGIALAHGAFVAEWLFLADELTAVEFLNVGGPVVDSRPDDEDDVFVDVFCVWSLLAVN